MVNKVFVCGGGHQGLSMAAHLALNGIDISLWNRTETNIKAVLDTHEIYCSGIVNGIAKIDKVSTNVKDVISDFIMITTPSSAHKDIAKYLAPYIKKEMIIVLNPGRTFGAIEFAETLKQYGVKDLPIIAETQTIVYTCRRSNDNSTIIYALKNDVQIATINPNDITTVMNSLPICLKEYFKPVDSIFVTSLSNVGMILHCSPVLMNVGWIESSKVDFKYYYDGISESVAHFLEKVDKERLAVAKALGYSVESTAEWLKRTYKIKGDTLYECLRNNLAYREIDAPKTLKTRYLYEDIPTGLVPVEDAGKKLSIPTPNITTIINLANAVLDEDFRIKGRKFPEKYKNC